LSCGLLSTNESKSLSGLAASTTKTKALISQGHRRSFGGWHGAPTGFPPISATVRVRSLPDSVHASGSLRERRRQICAEVCATCDRKCIESHSNIRSTRQRITPVGIWANVNTQWNLMILNESSRPDQ